jgi:transposase
MPTRTKTETLREEGTLNPRPASVLDTKFKEGEFFDPHDVVQVKYEMLRRVRVDDVPVTQAAEEFGFSRPTFYQAQSSFEEAGVAGLVPGKRGPRGPHKVRPEVLDFLASRVSPGQPVRARELAKALREELGVELHPRTIERAVATRKKTP